MSINLSVSFPIFVILFFTAPLVQYLMRTWPNFTLKTFIFLLLYIWFIAPLAVNLVNKKKKVKVTVENRSNDTPHIEIVFGNAYKDLKTGKLHAGEMTEIKQIN